MGKPKDFDLRVKLGLMVTNVNKRKRLLIAAAVAVATVTGIGTLLPLTARSSNCGGNSAALAACKGIALVLKTAAAERNGIPVSGPELTNSDPRRFDRIPGLNWLGGAKVLVTSGAPGKDESQARIVALCDTAFNNVPRPFFGKAPFSHAVAYNDGSTRLISVDEFRALDLSKFVDVRTLQSSINFRSEKAPAP